LQAGIANASLLTVKAERANENVDEELKKDKHET